LIDRDALWALIDKSECFHTPELGEKYEQRVTIAFEDGAVITKTLAVPRDVTPVLPNEEVLEKFRRFTKGIVDDRRREQIERLVLDIENVSDITALERLLAEGTCESDRVKIS
jgi:aconitate decarboxylase